MTVVRSDEQQRLFEWHTYEAANRRANVEYRRRPSIVPLIIKSLETLGLGRTSVKFGVAPAVLASASC